MAKKIKAKKSVSKALKFVDFASILLGLVAIFMIFVVAITNLEGGAVASFTGWDVVFGYSVTSTVLGSQITTTYLDFSFMNLIPYILLIVGVVLLVLNCIGKRIKFLYFICAGCFIAAAVLFFLTISMTVVHMAMIGPVSSPMIDLSNASLGVGPIISAICSILSGIACFSKIIFE